MARNTRHSRGRGRGRRESLAREPFALGLFLADNPNRGKSRAAVLNFAVRTLAAAEHDQRVAIARHGGAADRVTIPARDSLGRRNPRMAPRVYDNGRYVPIPSRD